MHIIYTQNELATWDYSPRIPPYNRSSNAKKGPYVPMFGFSSFSTSLTWHPLISFLPRSPWMPRRCWKRKRRIQGRLTRRRVSYKWFLSAKIWSKETTPWCTRPKNCWRLNQFILEIWPCEMARGMFFSWHRADAEFCVRKLHGTSMYFLFFKHSVPRYQTRWPKMD